MTSPVSQCGFYLDSPFLSGAEHQAINNIRDLQAEGNTVRVFLSGKPEFCDAVIQRLEGARVDFVANPTEFFKSNANSKALILLKDWLLFARTFFWALSQLVKKEFRFIHVNNGGYPGSSSARAFALAAILVTRAPVFMTVNNLAVSRSESAARYFDLAYDALIAKSRIRWIFGSQAAEARFQKVLGVRTERTHTLRNGASIRPCSSPPGKCPELLRLQQIVGSKLASLTIGHLETRKGHKSLVDAIAYLQTMGKLEQNWVFLIEGLGPEEGALLRLVRERQLEDKIVFLGRGECLYHTMALSQVLIHPSIFGEDLPNVVSEAMSMAKPVIGSAVAGIPEQVIDGDTGIIFEPGDIKALAYAIERLLTDSKLRREMGIAGRARYFSDFSPGVSRSLYKDFYNTYGPGQ